MGKTHTCYLCVNIKELGGSKPSEATVLSIYLILPAAIGLGFIRPLTEMSTTERNKEKFLESTTRPVREAHNLTATGELIV
jgi:hypothetical protein